MLVGQIVRGKVTTSAALTFELEPLQIAAASYAPELGILRVKASSVLIGIENRTNALSAQWRSAVLHFEIKYRGQQWELVPAAVKLELSEHHPEADEDDETPDFPPTDFWD